MWRTLTMLIIRRVYHDYLRISSGELQELSISFACQVHQDRLLYVCQHLGGDLMAQLWMFPRMHSPRGSQLWASRLRYYPQGTKDPRSGRRPAGSAVTHVWLSWINSAWLAMARGRHWKGFNVVKLMQQVDSVYKKILSSICKEKCWNYERSSLA